MVFIFIIIIIIIVAVVRRRIFRVVVDVVIAAACKNITSVALRTTLNIILRSRWVFATSENRISPPRVSSVERFVDCSLARKKTICIRLYASICHAVKTLMACNWHHDRFRWFIRVWIKRVATKICPGHRWRNDASVKTPSRPVNAT